MSACIPRKTVEEMLRKVAKKEEIARARDARINIWEITDEDVNNMLNDGNTSQIDAKKIDSDPIKSKLDSNLKYTRESTRIFIKNKLNEGGAGARLRAIAMETVMEQVKGEVDKAHNNDVKISTIASNDLTPDLGLHRLAATIGRKLLYLKGYTVTKFSEDQAAAEAIEATFYDFGMQAVVELEEQGFITIHHEGSQTIRDYLDSLQDEPSNRKSDRVTSDNPAISLNLDAFGIELNSKGQPKNRANKEALKHFTDRPNANLKNHPLGEMIQVISAVNLLSQPAYISFPNVDESSNLAGKHFDDVYERDGTLKAVTKELAETPVYIDETIGEFMTMLNDAINEGAESASAIMKDLLLRKPGHMIGLFKQNLDNRAASNKESVKGRNISSSRPFDDLAEYWGKFKGKAKKIFLDMFAGRNGRQYYDNGVLNPQTSKIMRHLFAVEPYSMDVGSEQHKWFVGKLAFNMDLDPEHILGTANPDDQMQVLNNSLAAFDRFVKGKTLNSRAIELSKMRAVAPGMDFAELVTTLKAIKEVRSAHESGAAQVTTTFMAASDATASGGTLTLLQAAGTNPAIAELLVEMGILGTAKGDKRKTPDVYKLLEREMEAFMEEVETEMVPLELQDAAKTRTVMKMAMKHLFKGIRDMAKKPTMTFIYGQSITGAEISIAKDMADRTIEQLKSGNKAAIDIINEVLNKADEDKFTEADIDEILDSETMMVDLTDGFKNSGMPAMMYDTLKGAVENKYLKEWKDRGTAIFQLLKRYPKLLKMKVLPASAVLEFKGQEITQEMLDKYGVPLSKKVSVRHDTYGVPVLTQEEKLTETVMTVSQIHTEDTAAAFRSLKGLPTKHNSGAIVIHDEARGSVPLVMELEGNYRGTVKELGNDYDIHEQVLLAASAYTDGAIEKDSDWIKYKAQVDASIETKREILKQFNDETDTIIGDSLPEVNLEGRVAKPTAAVTTPAVEADVATVGLDTLAGNSEIISEFVQARNQAKVDQTGDEAKFDPQTDTIHIPKGTSEKQAIELAEHEIVHSWTAAAVQQYYQDGGLKDLGFTGADTKQMKLDIGYVEKALNKIMKMDASKLPDTQADAISRIQSIAAHDTPTGVAELISVLSAEPKVADAIYVAIKDKGNLPAVIKRIFSRIREILSKVTAADFDTADIDVEKLYSAVNGAILEGKSMREQNYELTQELQKGFGNLYHTQPSVDERQGTVVTRYVDASNDAVARILLDPVARKGERLLLRLDQLLDTHFPAYSVARKSIGALYDTNTELGQLIHTITNANINKEKKNTILSAFSKVRAQKTEVTDVELQKFTKETSKLNPAQKKAFYDFTHRLPVHDYFMEVEKLLERGEITDMESGAKEWATKFTQDELSALDAIVEMRVKGVPPRRDTKYNVGQLFNPKKGKGIEARRYIVMKTISEIGQKEWDEFSGNKELFKLTRDVSLANAVLHDRQGNRMISDTLVTDWPEKPLDKRAVMAKDMWMYENPESGWTVHQTPQGSRPGIVYRRVIDQTYMEGAFTDMKFNSGDIDVGPEMRNMNGVVQTADGFKLVLDDETKKALGLFNNAEQGLVRSMTHAMAIQDSQNIRDKLLERDTYRNLDDTKPSLVEAMINDPDTDHPWFLGGKIEYNDLSPKLQAKYKPVGNRLSDVEGFNQNIKFVRKDIEHWLVGKNEKSLATDPKWQWALRITKNLVAGAKIGMVILNPMKIAADNVSNVAYLSVRGVDPLFIQKNYREISHQYHEYQKMANQLNHMRVRAIAAGEKSSFKKKVEQLEAKLKAHPANGFVERGFVNSLGSDIVLRAGDPSSGMKSDMDAVLKTLLQSKNGELNAAGKQLMKMANWNIGLDQFLEIWAKVPGALDSTKGMEAELVRTARRLKSIKTEEDAISYMHQYLNSPDSEFVKMGTYMTDLSDIVAKETLYRALLKRGKSPKEAEIDVIDSFPNYNENLPTRVKQLSDIGILMFPSYWLRIQRAIYRVMTDQPINFAAEMTIEQAMGIDAHNIWDANIMNKATSNYGIVHSPWEHVGIQSLIPMHAI